MLVCLHTNTDSDQPGRFEANNLPSGLGASSGVRQRSHLVAISSIPPPWLNDSFSGTVWFQTNDAEGQRKRPFPKAPSQQLQRVSQDVKGQLTKKISLGLPGGVVARFQRSHRRGLGSIPARGINAPQKDLTGKAFGKPLKTVNRSGLRPAELQNTRSSSDPAEKLPFSSRAGPGEI